MADYEMVHAKDDLEKGNGGGSNGVQVQSPADLPGNYEVEVIHEGKPWIATTPETGVLQGDMFCSELQEVPNPHNIPRGRWRDGFCDCFSHGGTLFTSWCCMPFALAHVMVRMKMDCCGRPNGSLMSAFHTLVYGFLLILFLAFLQGLATGYHNATDPYERYPVWLTILIVLRFVLQILHPIYALILLCITRRYVRRRYMIPGTLCPSNCPASAEDGFVSCFCTTCALSQMNRHTADYSMYEYSCCSEYGLQLGAPIVF